MDAVLPFLKDLGLILLDHGVEIVGMILMPIALMLVKRLIEYAENKLGIEINKEHERKIEKMVREAINYAEEQANKAIKETGEKPDQNEKLEHAIDYMVQNASEVGLHKLVEENRDVIAKKIEAKLFEVENRNDG